MWLKFRLSLRVCVCVSFQTQARHERGMRRLLETLLAHPAECIAVSTHFGVIQARVGLE